MGELRNFPKSEQDRLAELWHQIDTDKATSQDRIDAVTLAGKLRDQSATSRIWELTRYEDELVRYYALQAIVLDLGVKTAEAAELCWRLLEGDPDEDVRRMAAACLGSIFFGTGRLDVFNRLKEKLRSASLPGSVKGAIYSALFKLAGRPPADWPGLNERRKVFVESDIDWHTVSELEEAVRTAAPTS